MRRRSAVPIVLATVLPAIAALGGLGLGSMQIVDGLRHPPVGGLIGLGLLLGFGLMLGSLFVLCVSVVLGGLAFDVRDLRNRHVAREYDERLR